MATHIVERRYTELTKKDKAPMCTIAYVIDGDKEIPYIQTSPIENEPEWILLHTFLGEIFDEYIENKEFVDECMRIYHNKKDNPLFNIIKIMSEVSQ